MELGNALFGHSRGEYKVNRGLRDSFNGVLNATNSDGYGETSDEEHKNDRSGYENDTFCIKPYYWGDENDEDEVDAPNFLYKPTGFEIRWYKYPFRDSYMNQNLTDGEIIDIFNKCIESVGCKK